MISERLVQTDVPGGLSHNDPENKKSFSRFGVHRQLQTEVLKPGLGFVVGEKLWVKQHRSARIG